MSKLASVLIKDEFDETLHNTIELLCRQHAKTITRIDEDVACAFENYDWPGHYYELRNVLEFAVLSAKNGVIRLQNLPIWFFKSHTDKVSGSIYATLGAMEVPFLSDFYETLKFFEKKYLELALARFGGRIGLTARRIGMNKTTLIRRLRTHGLDAGARHFAASTSRMMSHSIS